jgi:hypothetical protein
MSLTTETTTKQITVPGETVVYTRRFEQEIIKLLDRNTAVGRRNHEVFRDWVDLSLASLEMLPAHAQAIANERRLAEDPEPVKELWKRLNSYYRREPYMENFAKAFGLLLQSTQGTNGPRYADTIGNIYMQFAYPNPGTGQYFTPFEVASMMAQMHEVADTVHERIKEAIAKDPLAQAMTLAGIALPESENGVKYFLEKVFPSCMEHYKPVTVCDPTVGSGVMLLAVASTLPQWMVHYGFVQFYGMDLDEICVKMAKINCLLYGLNGCGLKAQISLSGRPQTSEPEPQPQPWQEPADFPVGQMTLELA